MWINFFIQRLHESHCFNKLSSNFKTWMLLSGPGRSVLAMAWSGQFWQWKTELLPVGFCTFNLYWCLMKVRTYTFFPYLLSIQNNISSCSWKVTLTTWDNRPLIHVEFSDGKHTDYTNSYCLQNCQGKILPFFQPLT